MARRDFESPMDWSWEDQQQSTLDPTSPFFTTIRKDDKKNADGSGPRPIPAWATFSSVPRSNFHRGSSPSFVNPTRTIVRNPTFTTPRRPFDPSEIDSEPDFVNPTFTTPRRPFDPPEVDSEPDFISEETPADERPSFTGGEIVPFDKSSHWKKTEPKTTKQLFGRSTSDVALTRLRKRRSSRKPSHVDDKHDSPSDSTAASDFKRPDKAIARESTPVFPAENDRRGSSRESEWSQSTLFTLGVLAAIYIGGSFYYKVVSVSILAVWIYSAVMFPETDMPSLGNRQSRSFVMRFFTFVLGLAKLLGLLALLAWCVMISPAQIFIPTPMDAWTRYSDHPTFRSFEVLHDPGGSGVVEVFAIHGLGSNPLSAWRHADNGTQVYWLTDLLPKQKGLGNIKVIMLNHQTRWDSHSPDVDFDVFAKMMLDDIEHLHQKNRPIIFIAHSFGGLLLKRSLVLATTRSKDIPQMTRGILFLGVPHHGTKTAFVASLLACTAYWRGSSTTMLEYMSESNPAVAALDKEFYEAYARPNKIREYSTPCIYNFLEMQPERFGKLSLRPTVNANSGSLPYAEDVFLDTDHRGLNKFQSSDDPNFEKFMRYFYRALRRKNG